MEKEKMTGRTDKAKIDTGMVKAAVIVLLAVILVPVVIRTVRGRYDTSQGPGENYQTALENKDASLASLYDFQFEVNGCYFTVPMRYGDVKAMGVYDYPGDRTVFEAGETVPLGVWFIIGEPNEEAVNPLKERTAVWAEVRNYSSEKADLDDCIIDGMKIGRYKEKGSFNAILPQGITLDRSTTADVKKAYGRPAAVNKDPITDRYIYYYEMTGHPESSMTLYFDSDNVLYQAEVYNKRPDYS